MNDSNLAVIFYDFSWNNLRWLGHAHNRNTYPRIDDHFRETEGRASS